MARAADAGTSQAAGWEEVADYALDWAARHAAADVRRAQTAAQPVRGGSLGERQPGGPPRPV